MIRYSLTCQRRHSFESWFADSAAYDKQAKRGLVTCPHCGSAKVEKAIMSPQVADSKQKRRAKVGKELAAKSREAKPQPATGNSPQPSVSVVSPQERELRAKLKELRDHMTSKADNVGTKFTEEARKMHYGEIEHRSIYGEASSDQAKEMIDEGIEVYPMPVLPDDQN